MLFKKHAVIITGVTGLPKEEFPFFRSEKTFAGYLPVQQVDLLPLVPVGVDHEILVLLADPLHLPQGLEQAGQPEVVQGIDGDNEVEGLVGKGKANRLRNLHAVAHLGLGMGDGVGGDIDAANI